MKLLFFDDFKFGVYKDGNVIDCSSVVNGIPHAHPQDIIKGVIEDWSEYKGKLESFTASASGVPLSSVRVRPPLPRPAIIDCMAVNYMENGTRSEPAPIDCFHKVPGSIIGDGDTMVLTDIPATIFEGECELALVIGKTASNVSQADAYNYVFGYMNFIDGSARGLGPPNNGFFRMKSRDTFAPIGPFIVTADEIADPQHVQMKLWINGKLCQDFNTDDMGHKIPRCIEWLTSIHTLEPGDIIATGTNHRGLHPYQDGDKVEIEGEGLGRLTINVRDDLKRTWKPETRLERTEAGQEGPTPQVSGKHAPEAVKV